WFPPRLRKSSISHGFHSYCDNDPCLYNRPCTNRINFSMRVCSVSGVSASWTPCHHKIAVYMNVITDMKCVFPDRLLDVLSADQRFLNMLTLCRGKVQRMQQLLLLFVRATRESNWQLH